MNETIDSNQVSPGGNQTYPLRMAELSAVREETIYLNPL